MSHSILAPSSANRWVACPLSVLMAQTYPELEESESALEGTKAHDLATGMITSGELDASRVLMSGHFPQPDANYEVVPVVLDADIISGANLYARNVLDTVSNTTPTAKLYAERRLDCRRIHPSCFGTCDSYLYDEAAHRLIIWEYKYGYLVVEPFELWQAICYYAGILFEHNIINDQELTVEIRVVQPRAPHRHGSIRSWATNGGDLRAYVNRLASAAADALTSRPEARSGSHCVYCRGRHACDVAQQASVQLYEAASVTMPAEMSPETISAQLSIMRRGLEQMKSLEAAYSERVTALIKSGVVVPGWAMSPTTGREEWTVTGDQVVRLGELYNINLKKDATLTPNQARGVGIPADVIKQYADRSKTGFKLEPVTANDVRRQLQ